MPEIITVLMTAGNAGHAMVKQYTDSQTLLEIFNRAQTYKKADYKEIARAVGKFRRDDEMDLIGSLCSFVEAWAGGGSTHLLEMDRWSKTLDTRRTIAPWTYSAMAKVSSPMPRLIYAILKAFYSAPQNFVVQGYSQILTQGDLTNICGKKKDQCEAANKLMQQAFDSLEKLRTANRLVGKETEAAHILGNLEIRAVMCVFKKTSETRMEFKSLLEVGAQFMRDLKAAKVKVLENPWEDAEEKLEERLKNDEKEKEEKEIRKRRKKASGQIHGLAYNARGEIAEPTQLAEMGYAIDKKVILYSFRIATALFLDPRQNFDFNSNWHQKQTQAQINARIDWVPVRIKIKFLP